MLFFQVTREKQNKKLFPNENGAVTLSKKTARYRFYPKE